MINKWKRQLIILVILYIVLTFIAFLMGKTHMHSSFRRVGYIPHNDVIDGIFIGGGIVFIWFHAVFSHFKKKKD